jgi:hypothetical protein
LGELNQIMRLLPITLLLVLISLTVDLAQGASGQVKGEVWFKPFVENENVFNNVPLPNCEIVFRSNAMQKKVVTDEAGHYAAELPPGTYSATASCMMASNHWEYHVAERPEFEVKRDSSSLVNLMVLI